MQSFLSEDRYSPDYNWLKVSKSQYLKQYEKNPVNWLEWTEETFDKAKREGKLVMISIGCRSCHWCEVMKSESFEDAEIAKLLNDWFISIKVDREERPDIYSKYLNIRQEVTGNAGLPLTMFLSSDQRLLFAGNYLPKESRDGGQTFKEIIIEVYTNYFLKFNQGD
ncbi:DUF255 domain-containing protein [Bacillus sp. S/N-304-OC-R1]|uniref:DUF255 domain-containing protein n=1 Tax=Bacillus sp. S/N-304-OC-R1 TaxID=2758034 RepID=UPI001C8DC6DF|nr:DUF255 domain-containing protein [Bacillus sp. S/N-304-OC-R1]MBY0121353.1 DUF255 domain-containing protein [Bacillus sp. S/N-304-OC-R1]